MLELLVKVVLVRRRRCRSACLDAVASVAGVVCPRFLFVVGLLRRRLSIAVVLTVCDRPIVVEVAFCSTSCSMPFGSMSFCLRVSCSKVGGGGGAVVLAASFFQSILVLELLVLRFLLSLVCMLVGTFHGFGGIWRNHRMYGTMGWPSVVVLVGIDVVVGTHCIVVAGGVDGGGVVGGDGGVVDVDVAAVAVSFYQSVFCFLPAPSPIESPKHQSLLWRLPTLCLSLGGVLFPSRTLCKILPIWSTNYSFSCCNFFQLCP